MPSSRNAKRAQSFGAQLERLIEISCRDYSVKGLAHIQKTPEPFRITGKGRNGTVQGFYEKQAQPDFTGTLKGGRSVVFESKHTNSTNISFDVITHTQHKELNKHDRLGAMTFVLVGFELKRFYRVPWKDWKNNNRNIGKKSMNEKDLAKYKVDVVNGIIKFLEK